MIDGVRLGEHTGELSCDLSTLGAPLRSIGHHLNAALVALIVVAAFVIFLVTGRTQIAKGSNAHVANGAMLLTLAAIIGTLAMGVLLSLDVW